MREMCEYTIKDGHNIYACEKKRGHKGKHGIESRSNDGRVISISWRQTEAEHKEAKEALATVSQEGMKDGQVH